MPDVVIIRRCSYRHEAEVVRSVLDASGIPAFVASDDCGSVDPALGLVRGASVAVAESDVARAEEVLSAECDATGDAGQGEGEDEGAGDGEDER